MNFIFGFCFPSFCEQTVLHYWIIATESNPTAREQFGGLLQEILQAKGGDRVLDMRDLELVHPILVSPTPLCDREYQATPLLLASTYPPEIGLLLIENGADLWAGEYSGMVWCPNN